MKIRAILAVAALLLATGSASADWSQGSRLVALSAGAALPFNKLRASGTGGEGKPGGPGFSISGQYLYHVLPEVAFGLEVGYTGLAKRSSDDFIPTIVTESRARSTVGLALAKWALWTNGGFLPYGVLGAGLHVSELKLDSGSGKLMDDSRSAWAGMVGVGADIPLGRRLVAGIEARYLHLGKVTYRPTRAGRTTGLTGIEGATREANLSVRLGWQF
jgi:opacity protein-like surface antigen